MPIALLLDIDGTLLDFADRPDAVVVDDVLRTLLTRLQRALGGAFALVSGRGVPDIDRLFAPFRSAVIGLHGVEMRPSADAALRFTSNERPPVTLIVAVAAVAVRYPGMFVEDKGACVAVHHLLDRAATVPVLAQFEALLAQHAPHWNCINGRSVIELKPRSVDKGTACGRLLDEAAFHGRVPVYVGDDTTDLDAFEVVGARGGRTVSVGPRLAGRGDLALAGPNDARAWLEAIAAVLENPLDSSQSGAVGALAALLTEPCPSAGSSASRN